MKINRETERRLTDWIKKLTPEQQFFLTKFVEAETEKAMMRVLSIIELSIFAATRENFPELSSDEIFDFIGVYVQEFEANSKYISVRKEQFEMIRSQENKAEKKTIELLNSGLDQKNIIDQLRKEFRELTASDIKNIYKRTKDEWLKPKVKAEGYVKEIQLHSKTTKLKEEDIKLLNSKEEVVEVEVEAVKIVKESNKKENELTGIEILEPIKIKYKNEIITIGPDYLECAEGRFDTLKDLEEYRDEEIKLFKNKIENIRQVVEKFSF